MKGIHLVAVGDAGAPGTLETLAAGLARTFHVPVQVRPAVLDPDFAWHQSRGQYYSTLILNRLEPWATRSIPLLGVTAVDLFVPVLTFVFGEAQLAGRCAVVSTCRLHEEFYGLPPHADLMQERLLKEAAHELGHTLGLRHCEDWSCVMASSHGVELLDVKSAEFCPQCRDAGGLRLKRRPRLSWRAAS